MIGTILALMISGYGVVQEPTGAEKPVPGKLITKMFARYANATTVIGTIAMTQTANGVSVHTRSELQFDRPSKLYLRQVRDGALAGQWLVTSDGSYWSYDRPDTVDPHLMPPREVELVSQNHKTQTVPDLIDAASHSLGDLNAIIISAVSSKTRLKAMISQWSDLTYQGEATVGNQNLHRIVGAYHNIPSAPQSGDIELLINNEGDFVRYKVHQRLSFPKVSAETVEVTTIWESDLKVGGPTNSALYKVVR